MDSRARMGDTADTPPAQQDGLVQRVAAIDDLLQQAVSAARAECRLAPAFFTQLDGLLQRSEALRVASTLDDRRAMPACAHALAVASKQTLELARRTGRAGRDLLMLLQILTRLVVDLAARLGGR